MRTARNLSLVVGLALAGATTLRAQSPENPDGAPTDSDFPDLLPGNAGQELPVPPVPKRMKEEPAAAAPAAHPEQDAEPADSSAPSAEPNERKAGATSPVSGPVGSVGTAAPAKSGSVGGSRPAAPAANPAPAQSLPPPNPAAGALSAPNSGAAAPAAPAANSGSAGTAEPSDAAASPESEAAPQAAAHAPPAAIRPPTPTASTVEEKGSRPFRLGFLNLDKNLDAAKPLAMLDPAGFVINSGILIGAFDSRWVGGYNMANRKVSWWFDGPADMTAPPGSFGTSAVLGFRNGSLIKLDAVSGKKLWTASLDSFCERPFLLSGTTLYVLTAAQVLYAIDFQSGKTIWLFDGSFPDGLTIRGGARPLVHDNKVIFGIATGEILAVSVDTGKLVWRYNPSYNDARFHGVIGEMVVRNNKLLITRYDGLVAAIDLNATVRSVSWQEQFPGLTTSAFRGNRLYVGGLNGDVHALDADTGRRIFRAVTGAAVTSIAAGETALYVAGHKGRISALDAANGNLLWDDGIGGALASPPVLFEDGIYYATGTRSIYAYKLR